jgi:GNAT superfamily N-acetyltransferase
MLHEGYTDIPPGKLANVVTYLEMVKAPPARSDPPGIEATLVRISGDLQRYRALFRAVGEPYLWGSRLVMSDAELLRVATDPRNEIYAARTGERDVGILELDFRTDGECELGFFGLTPDATGRGLGRWLMNRALERAWSQPIERFWVHTCTLDHPEAVAFYVRSGFVPFKRAIEILDDPRLQGLLPREAAPDVPIL